MREEATVWGEPTHRGRVPLALDPPYVGPSVSDQKTVENGVVETTGCLVGFFPYGITRQSVRVEFVVGAPPPDRDTQTPPTAVVVHSASLVILDVFPLGPSAPPMSLFRPSRPAPRPTSPPLPTPAAFSP